MSRAAIGVVSYPWIHPDLWINSWFPLPLISTPYILALLFAANPEIAPHPHAHPQLHGGGQVHGTSGAYYMNYALWVDWDCVCEVSDEIEGETEGEFDEVGIEYYMLVSYVCVENAMGWIEYWLVGND